MAKNKMPISDEQWRELDTLTKRANQRIASAYEGQRRALEYYVPEGKFSRAKPTSVGEYNDRMRRVERFLASKQTKRRGWNEIKKKAVKHAGQTLRKERKYELTDDELADIFEEISRRKSKVFYKILDLVEARKYEAMANDNSFDLQDAIDDAFELHVTAKEALQYRREQRKKFKSSKDLRK